MDPVSLAGLALGVASLGLQVYTGCIQGIQLVITALDYGEDCKYLNLRLRMEQQRLYAWSETSGLLDLDAQNHERILSNNIFNLHRQTVLDLLVQTRCLFDHFTEHQKRHRNLVTVPDDANVLTTPDQDAKQASFPMPERKSRFIRRAMESLKATSQEGLKRLRWVSIDKDAFEELLSKFSLLNDAMMNILDHSLQVEIRHTVQDTNRGVLLLHHKIADLSHLVLALKAQLDLRGGSGLAPTHMSKVEREANAADLRQLSRLAKFKAFNETIDPKSANPSSPGAAAIASTAAASDVDDAAALFGLEMSGRQQNILVPKYHIDLDPDVDKSHSPRCEAVMKVVRAATADSGTLEGEEGGVERKKVWIEWKDYDTAGIPGCLSKEDIFDRVRKLASLLNHSPKPEAFRTPHCLGFFDKADPDTPDDDVDILDRRLGLIFERPCDPDLDESLPPVSLRELLQDGPCRARKPRVTDRVRLAHALSNCLLHLHAVDWLHKGLRSHSILFFRDRCGLVDYAKPYVSGFDFSRPGGNDEMTESPGLDAEHDLYRHPRAQSSNNTATTNNNNNGKHNRNKNNCEDPPARERSKKSFDIYSLGVIFAELAHWRTIDAVLGIEMRLARGQSDVVRQVRSDLLHPDSLADVGAEMGHKFEDAVRTCLTGEAELGLGPGDDETASDVAARLSMRYYEDVVKKLAQIVV